MDEFRQLLEIAKEFNISFFKKGDIEVHFQLDYSKGQSTNLFEDLKNVPDADEDFLKKIDELKMQANGNTEAF